MSDQIYEKGKVLMLDEDEQPLAVACKTCGRFALNTDTGLCASCTMGGNLAASVDLLARGRAVLDRLRDKPQSADAVDPHVASAGKPSTRA